MSVMKEAFATALPSRIKSFARNCVTVKCLEVRAESTGLYM